MISADDIQALEVEYALFNASRTLASASPCAMEQRSLGGALLLVDRSRPGSSYANRILGLSEDSCGSLDAMLEQYSESGHPPRVDLRLEDGTPPVLDELFRRGYRQRATLYYLACEPRSSPVEAVGHDIRRWTHDEADAFLDLLESNGGSPIARDVRSARRSYYCTDRFRTFVTDLEGRPAAWATLFVSADGKHGYCANAFTRPECRGRGLHRGLLQARLCDGAALGVETLVTDVEPGTASLRNCRRVGFQIESVHLIWEL